MAARPDPKPAELPLPGGRDGATVRLHPLLVAEATWPDAYPHRRDGRLAQLHAFGFREPRSEWVPLPIVAFLVEHPGVGPFLIDTGFDPSVAEDPKRDFGRVLARTTRTLEMDPSAAVPEQLRARGIDRARVGLVVMTHLHYDHASGMRQFPSATFVVTEREWEAAHVWPGSLHGYVSSHFDQAFDIRTVDFEAPAVTSYSTFGRSLDLLGDGSVRLLSTPGHTHGHMSVLLRTSAGEILVVGDAAYTRRTLRTGQRPARSEDEHLFGRSLREIQLYSDQHPDALLIPGHDMGAWQALEAIYE